MKDGRQFEQEAAILRANLQRYCTDLTAILDREADADGTPITDDGSLLLQHVL